MNKGNSLQEKDFEALGRLHETFPYFSIPHILAAKYQIRQSKGEFRDFLHWASVQSVDRIWLKQLIEKDIDFLSPIAEDPESEDLIETIKKREKKEILDARQKEQNDLIKAFSQKSIRLVVPRDKQDEGNTTDLSKNSTLFNDNIISESFAKLLVQQNKKEKALEIYHKLKLKFPNKSAYFADLIKQIEEKKL